MNISINKLSLYKGFYFCRNEAFASQRTKPFTLVSISYIENTASTA